ncbi:MAG: alpha/beta hydrolase [Caldiserica bacterium]|nr:alpha/beta hydrolase [Caldisericota bacterium]MDH7562848.1 alpha/beta hydrolase [Caldisericota bacterium]
MKKWLRVIVLLTLAILFLLIVVPFLIPIPPLVGTFPPEELADENSLFCDVLGIKVHFKQAGSGERAFFLLHGFASSIFSFREVMAPLSELGKVVAWDRPGFGLTQRPLPGEWEGESPYSPEFQAKLTVKLMDKMNVSRAILVGHSAGGAIALFTAILYPERVQGLILISPAVYSQGGIPGFIRFLLNTPQGRHLGPLLIRSFANQGKELAQKAWNDPSRITPEIWEGYLKPLKARNWDQGLFQFLLSSHPLPLENNLPELKIPVLIIHGENDGVIPLKESFRLKESITEADLDIIPDCGHIPQEESPEAFLKAVKDFIKRKGL